MIKRILSLIMLAATVLVWPCVANRNQQAELPPDIYVTRLSERILQLKARGPLGTNIIVIATQKGLVVIDTYTAPFIFEQVTEIAKKEFGRDDFAYVINSHDHVDHAGGNGFFKDIIMVGHEELFKELCARHTGCRQWQTSYRGRIRGWINGREEKLAGLDKESAEAKELVADVKFLKKVDKDFANGFLILPDNPKEIISFKDSYVLELGDITIECYDCQAGHSPGDVLIYIPQEKFLFTGDAAQSYIQSQVNMKQWLVQLEHFSQTKMPLTMILDGHGAKPFAKEELKRLHDYFKETWESVEKEHKQGLSLEQIKIKCALDNIPSVKSLLDTPFADTPENFTGIHEHNIELIVNRLNQR
ncbi:MAG: MBL fold metallo-hydrolase [Sedimentisphaerales bacterium]|nr:MBL fold metallo-hydrolase [Sedimentisphaerales bacterium]